MPNLRNGTKGGFEPGLSRLRVRHSTTKLPRSTLIRRLSVVRVKTEVHVLLTKYVTNWSFVD